MKEKSRYLHSIIFDKNVKRESLHVIISSDIIKKTEYILIYILAAKKNCFGLLLYFKISKLRDQFEIHSVDLVAYVKK